MIRIQIGKKMLGFINMQEKLEKNNANTVPAFNFNSKIVFELFTASIIIRMTQNQLGQHFWSKFCYSELSNKCGVLIMCRQEKLYKIK